MGYGNALKYGYSNTRVKAMEAKLLSSAAMQDIINAKDAGSILSLLIQSDYEQALSHFGGVSMKQSLIDFALSKNFAERITKLVGITPKAERQIIMGIASKWDISNIKLALEAKDRGMNFDDIERYIIDYGRYNLAAIREAMREESVEAVLSKLVKNSPYSDLLRNAFDAYKRNGDITAALALLDIGYYRLSERSITQLERMKDRSVTILRMDIDMKNILTLARAKRRGIKYDDVSHSLVMNGELAMRELRHAYSTSEDVESFLSYLRSYDLKDAIATYKATGQLISIEIGLRNNLFRTSLRLLRHSVLSFGTILAYVYLKEIEVFTLRILIKSKVYGLSKDDISRLITWKAG